MPTLINYSGDDDFYSGSLYAHPTDSSLVLSLGSHVDVYCPSRKRSRISAPFVFRGDKLEQKKRPSIDVLHDECLFEIFRRLPGGQERSSCASVSKRWLTLLSTIRSTDICGRDSLKPDGGLVSSKIDESSKLDKESILPVSNEDDEQDLETDGHLSRCLEGKKATDIRLAAIAVGTSSRGGLGKLLIRGSNSIRGVTDLGISAIARGCPSLRVLSLWNVSSISDEGLLEIANGCHMLEKLDLCQSQISDKGLIAIAENCPNLNSLTIESCPNIGNEGLQAIGKHCPNLQSVSIKDCPCVGDQGVASLLSSTLYVMKKVKLQGVNVTDVSLAVLGHYGKAVTDISLTGLQKVSERGFWVMGNAHGLQKLKSITISSCRGVTDLGLEAVGKGCPNLKQLRLSKCSFLSDNGLVAFARTAVSLECMQLEECNRVTQRGVLGAISNCGGTKLKALSLMKCMGIKDVVLALPMLSPCKSLRSLSISNCPGFGSLSLAMVGNLCPQLQNIDLSGLSGITDAGILPLIKSCEAGLVKVNFSGCMNLTDAVVKAIASHHGETLRLLNLDGCSNITDASLVAIAESCTLLHDLDVSKSTITDFGIVAVSSAKQLDLQILSLSGCSNVTDKSIPLLGKLGQTLVGLNIQQCKSISSRAVELLVEHLWRCDILS